jgi:hypothetical protein
MAASAAVPGVAATIGYCEPGATASGAFAVKMDSDCSYRIDPPDTWKRPDRMTSAMNRFSVRVRSRRITAAGEFRNRLMVRVSPEIVGAAGG